MSTVGVSISGTKEVLGKLTKFSDVIDTDKLLDEGAAILFHNILDRFLRETDPDGVPFEPIKPATERAKIKKYGGGTILYASGTLFRSLQLYKVPDGRAIGTDVPYAKFHQYGTINMKRRTFLGFSTEDVDTVHDFLLRRISEAIRG